MKRVDVRVTANPMANQDEPEINISNIVGIAADPDGKVIPRTPPANGMGGTLEAYWAAGTPKLIPHASAVYTRENAGNPQAGWMHFQPLWQEVCRTDPDLFE